MPNSAPALAERPSRSPFFWRTLLWTWLSLAVVLAWDVFAMDRGFAHWFGDAGGFALRSDWFLVNIVHEGGRRLAWLVVLGLTLCVWRPVGVLRHLPHGRRVQLVSGILLSLAAISVLKYTSTTSCPWDLAEFGGVARYVSHWSVGLIDGGPGRCFPAGHASTGFAFLAGYFALRHHAPRAARLWLATALGAGLLMGLAQQMRGAHFMSHTLWTGWLCWTTGWIWDLAATAWLRRHADQDTDSLLPADSPAATA
ncbi:MAG: phosphatase PAP2 family protein [Burkholderiaceae bacterium]|jgi:membrane-associated PAP2 superfamily phosphatase|nr:phosphatase PAP2 family protein [Burkholderiaceae bacterium]